ncbi:MAG: riboflavin synthase [Saprospiraceae bacterium]|nr:riboflavin synthase [Saprospiraceae bacterium]
MFTGIVEALGEIVAIREDGSNRVFTITCSFTGVLKIDQSLAHNGVCLTVVAIEGEAYDVVAIEETLKKTNLGSWQVGDRVNLERSVSLQQRLDGHIVQGHVDAMVTCTSVEEVGGSWYFTFAYAKEWFNYLIPKGSVCLNGVSLTIAELTVSHFQVAIIPYTYEHTTFHALKEGQAVNIEFDMLGKYINRIQQGKVLEQ